MNKVIKIDLDFFKDNKLDISRKFNLTIDEQTAKEFFVLINQTWEMENKPDLIKQINLSIWQSLEQHGIDLEEMVLELNY